MIRNELDAEKKERKKEFKMDSADIYKGLAYAAIASTTAGIVTHPLDTMKVTIQVEMTAQRTAYEIMQSALRSKGWRFLYNGIEPCILRSMTYGSLRYAFYSPTKRLFGVEKESSFMTKVLSGSISGSVAAFLCNPTDLIKIRMQSSAHHKYKNIVDAFKQVIKADGVKGLWVGCVPTASRATALAASELSTYDEAKDFLTRNTTLEGHSLFLLSSTTASCVAAICSNPFDVAKSRVMSQPLDALGNGTIYRGMVHCMYSSVQKEGLLILWAGLISTFIRLVPNITITFAVMEQLKSMWP